LVQDITSICPSSALHFCSGLIPEEARRIFRFPQPECRTTTSLRPTLHGPEDISTPRAGTQYGAAWCICWQVCASIIDILERGGNLASMKRSSVTCKPRYVVEYACIDRTESLLPTDSALSTQSAQAILCRLGKKRCPTAVSANTNNKSYHG
jgi:hypothetical protein